MADMERKLVLIGLSILILAGCFERVETTATQYRLTARVGSAISFNLPAVSTCGRFILTDPQSHNVVTVYNGSYSETDRNYVHRSIISSLSNGSLLFTLHKIQHSDNGTFLIKPGGQSPELCWRQYVLITYEDIFTAWSQWSPWSNCSEQCGNGRHSRHRYCLRKQLHRVDSKSCTGNSFDIQNCTKKPCATSPTVGTFANQWTDWGSWSSCSATCGPGYTTRDRQCHDQIAIIETEKCTGLSRENDSCKVSECPYIGETSPGPGNDESGADEKVIQLPLYSIVGAGAGVFILLLIIVICVLVMKLKKKGTFKTGNTPIEGRIRKKESVISFSSQGVSGVHVYDEIDDVKSQRMSVLTIDNPYVTMPKSPIGSQRESVAYNNTQESVFVFDNTVVGGQFENRKVSCAYQNIESKAGLSDRNKLTVPRHMSVDSTGYLMPGTTLERAAARRQKKYTK